VLFMRTMQEPTGVKRAEAFVPKVGCALPDICHAGARPAFSPDMSNDVCRQSLFHHTRTPFLDWGR
jgi:hypothetical protein